MLLQVQRLQRGETGVCSRGGWRITVTGSTTGSHAGARCVVLCETKQQQQQQQDEPRQSADAMLPQMAEVVAFETKKAWTVLQRLPEHVQDAPPQVVLGVEYLRGIAQRILSDHSEQAAELLALARRNGLAIDCSGRNLTREHELQVEQLRRATPTLSALAAQYKNVQERQERKQMLNRLRAACSSSTVVHDTQKMALSLLHTCVQHDKLTAGLGLPDLP